jgi:lipid-binding SYLF domain-containing protein
MKEMRMKRWMSATLVLVMIATVPVALAEEEEKETKTDKKRAEIDARSKEALDELFASNEKAKGLYDTAHGYAVFGNWKFALGISGGGGSGVAVNKGSGERTYMNMGTVGVGLGFGGKKYQVVFVFEDEKRFTGFVEKGWQADTSATAAAGTATAEAGTGFVDGIAIYQITDAGVMAQADIAGTKYWKDKKLNEAE